MNDSESIPKISIVIPAVNEVNFLPVLIESIEAQDFRDYEIIVADAGSTDGTREYATDHGCRVIEGGMPARGRNAGATVARGEFLFFLDSDVRLPKGFLRNAWDEIERRFADLATCEARPISTLGFDKALFNFASTVTRLTARSDPRATGFCILVSRRLFRRVGGFDESITLGEDHAFSKAAAKIRPLEFLNSTWVEVSVRRLEKEGRIAYVLKAVHADLHRKLIGEIRRDLIDYEFASYDSVKPGEPASQSIVAKLDRLLVQTDEGVRSVIKTVRDAAAQSGDQPERLEQVQEQFEQLARDFRKRLRRKRNAGERDAR